MIVESKHNRKYQFRPAPFMNDMKSPHNTDSEHEPSRASQFQHVGLPTHPLSGSDPSESSAKAGENRSAASIAELDTISSEAVNLQRSPEPPAASSPLAGRMKATSPKFLRDSQYLYRWRNRRVQLAALCVIALLGLVGISLWHFLGRGIPDVIAYRVSMKNVEQQIGGGGTAYPVQRLDISYPFPTHVLSVFVQPGEKVTPNQALVQIDLSQVNAQNLEQLNVQVEQAYQDMLAAQSYLDTVLRVGNPVVIAQARQQYDSASSKYKALQAEANAPSLHEGSLTSTIGGVVTAVNVYPGQELGASKVMLTIFDESSIIVRAQIPLSSYGQVYIKQPALVTPSALSAQHYSGTTISIIPAADSQSGTFEVWIEVANTAGTLLPGMTIFVSIQNTIKALVVPRLAVLNPDQGAVVFIVHQQHAFIQNVQVAGYVGDTLLISSGLQADDLIVLVGLDSLYNGQAVHVTGIER